MAELVGIKCENCGKEIIVLESSIREEMFCTIGCMIDFKNGNFNN